MGGHGGLNILPQKRWNVYNFDNREKVKKDEEEAAKEEQIKREQSRKRDAEFRLQLLRQARGLATPPGPHGSAPPTEPPQASASAPEDKEAASISSSPDSEPEPENKSKFNHINLFEGIKIFDLPKVEKKRKGDDDDDKRSAVKKMKKEAPPRVVLPEDEKYRMGYGVAGKGVKLPWYMSKPSDNDSAEKDDGSDDDYKSREVKGGAKSGGKKTLQELREERLKREKREKERERALLDKGRRVVPELPDRYHHRRGGK